MSESFSGPHRRSCFRLNKIMNASLIKLVTRPGSSERRQERATTPAKAFPTVFSMGPPFLSRKAIPHIPGRSVAAIAAPHPLATHLGLFQTKCSPAKLHTLCLEHVRLRRPHPYLSNISKPLFSHPMRLTKQCWDPQGSDAIFCYANVDCY